MPSAIGNSGTDFGTDDTMYFPRTSRPVLVFTPIETCGEGTVRPESAHQRQWLPSLLPDPEFIINNYCNEDLAGCCDDYCEFFNEWGRYCRCPGNLVNGGQYPAVCQTCGGATTSALPHFATRDHATRQYRCPDASSAGQVRHRDTPSAFTAPAASCCAAKSPLQPYLCPTYTPHRRQGRQGRRCGRTILRAPA